MLYAPCVILFLSEGFFSVSVKIILFGIQFVTQRAEELAAGLSVCAIPFRFWFFCRMCVDRKILCHFFMFIWFYFMVELYAFHLSLISANEKTKPTLTVLWVWHAISQHINLFILFGERYVSLFSRWRKLTNWRFGAVWPYPDSWIK